MAGSADPRLPRKAVHVAASLTICKYAQCPWLEKDLGPGQNSATAGNPRTTSDPVASWASELG